MSLRLRDALDADAQAVAGLLHELGYPSSPTQAAQLIESFRRDPASRTLVAVRDGHVIGLLATHILPRFDSELSSCRIVDLVVTASEQGSGVGTILVAEAEAEARRHGARRLELISHRHRTGAHAFYERLGFHSQHRSFTKQLI